MKIPTIEEINSAIKYANVRCKGLALHYRQDKAEENTEVVQATLKFARNLMQAIEDGRVAVVPTKPTKDMSYQAHHEDDNNDEIGAANIYKAAIKAAPDEFAKLWSGE